MKLLMVMLCALLAARLNALLAVPFPYLMGAAEPRRSQTWDIRLAPIDGEEK